VQAHRNAAVAGPGCYAIIKFYSAGDAGRAQHACKGQRLFQKSPLKVSRTAPGGQLAGLSAMTSSSSRQFHETLVDLCGKSLGWMLSTRWHPLPGSQAAFQQ